VEKVNGMLHELVFRSDELPAAERLDAWRERMSSTHAPLRLESEHAANFHAHQRLIDLGAVSMWPARFEQLVFLRTAGLIRQSDPDDQCTDLHRSSKDRQARMVVAPVPGDRTSYQPAGVTPKCP
jgi:hypothetical protein